MPACYAQAFCQGLSEAFDSDKKLLRSLKILANNGSPSRNFLDENNIGQLFFPLDSDPHFRLGYDYVVNAPASSYDGWLGGAIRLAKNLYHSKKLEMHNILGQKYKNIFLKI